ncbi:MAG: hypothetical protein C6H99_01745 [Epsilonproteobacteria bacterium]|nr:hypothetical protein [Campylobacterota bacterium]NPA63423.1 rhodanese-like domain-containing protein [Campylobacterota bacterium]
MKKALGVLVYALLLFAQEKISYEEDIDVQEAYEMMQKGAILIDVRTAGEYIYAGHPLGAVSIPVFEYSYKPKAITLRVKFAQKEHQKALDAHKIYDITPIENKNFLQSAKKAIALTKAKKILVICRSGARSAYAANILAKEGFSGVYNVEGGFLEWKKAKLPYSGE